MYHHVMATHPTREDAVAPPVTALRARISENTPRDLRGVETLLLLNRVIGR